MTTLSVVQTPITAQHQARLAYVYVRQSSMGQVVHHGESTELQYELVERAVALGWPRERVRVIDEDLGHSAAWPEQRSGFQHLIAELSLARVGLVLSREASRLARNHSDWHRLVELCGLFGTLIADGERLYDPGAYHDRLLLGLSGMLSEAELHQLKLRLHAGARHKAERGELRLGLPVGLVRQADGSVGLDPDQEVQARIRLVFQKFTDLGSARAVMHYLRRSRLPLPVRRRRGPEPHPVTWEPARTSRVLGLLKNPAYAGTYVYGRTVLEVTRRRPGQRYSGVVHRPPEQWPVCLPEVYPAYLRWDEFVRNQAQLRANQSRYSGAQPGVPRQGRALLQGIAHCGRCGGWMTLGYSGRRQYPVYRCADAKVEHGSATCQEVRAEAVDAVVETQLLAALAPDQVELALAALEALEQEDHALEQQWQLRRERARYEAERAQRQYHLVEPEHRLVARTLEAQWEVALRAVEQVEHEYEQWRRQPELTLSVADREALRALGENFPVLWHAPTTTVFDRKRLLRLLMRDVLLDNRRARGQVWLQINWQTGAVTEHWLRRSTLSYSQHADLEELKQQVLSLHATGHVDTEIAATLNRTGFRTAHGRPFNGRAVWYLRRSWGLPPVATTTSIEPSGAAEQLVSAEEAAALIGVWPTTIYKWLRLGRLRGAQAHSGLPWKVIISPKTIAALQAHVARARRVKHREVIT